MTPSSARFSQMFSSSPGTMMNNGGELDGSGTINPANLNPAGAFAAPHTAPISRIAQSFYGAPPSAHDYNADSKPRVPVMDTSPRGVKRSRSPEVFRDNQAPNEDINQGGSCTYLNYLLRNLQIISQITSDGIFANLSLRHRRRASAKEARPATEEQGSRASKPESELDSPTASAATTTTTTAKPSATATATTSSRSCCCCSPSTSTSHCYTTKTSTAKTSCESPSDGS